MKAKLSLLAIPVVLGLGTFGVMTMTAAHAAPASAASAQQTAPDKEAPDAKETPGAKEAPDAKETPETSKVDDPNGPNVEQTGQNESAH